ncbi:MAG: redoxin domain-containing protein [Bacteroidota bacterium]
MPQINQPAPDFLLPDLTGSFHRLSDHKGKIVVVNFWSCECVHSERTDRSIMTALPRWEEDVVMLTVACNRGESLELIRQEAEGRRLPLVLMDPEQRVTNLYGAVVTPEAFVIDREGILRYHGAVDDVGFRQRTATRFYVEEAVETLLENRQPAVQETLAFGCAIVREI